jgi:hypothetical protein
MIDTTLCESDWRTPPPCQGSRRPFLGKGKQSQKRGGVAVVFLLSLSLSLSSLSAHVREDEICGSIKLSAVVGGDPVRVSTCTPRGETPLCVLLEVKVLGQEEVRGTVR